MLWRHARPSGVAAGPRIASSGRPGRPWSSATAFFPAPHAGLGGAQRCGPGRPRSARRCARPCSNLATESLRGHAGRLLDELRRQGHFPRLADRARDKRLALERAGADGATPLDMAMTPAVLRPGSSSSASAWRCPRLAGPAGERGISPVSMIFITACYLAPGQAVRVRPLGAGDEEWTSVDDGSIDTRHTYRWSHPSGDGRGVTIVFYEGSLSHEVAFGLGSLSSVALVERAEHLLSDSDEGGVVCVATDGETFGHHHRWGERAVAYALAVEAPRHGLATGGLADVALDRTPEWEVEVKEARGRARMVWADGRRTAAATPAEVRGGISSGRAVTRRAGSSPRPRHRGL